MSRSRAPSRTFGQNRTGIELRRLIVAACSTVTPMSLPKLVVRGSGHSSISSDTDWVMPVLYITHCTLSTPIVQFAAIQFAP